MLSSDFNKLLAVNESYFSLKWQDRKRLLIQWPQETRPEDWFTSGPGSMSRKEIIPRAQGSPLPKSLLSLSTQPGCTVKCPFLPLDCFTHTTFMILKWIKVCVGLNRNGSTSSSLIHSQRQHRICHVCIWMAQWGKDRHLQWAPKGEKGKSRVKPCVKPCVRRMTAGMLESGSLPEDTGGQHLQSETGIKLQVWGPAGGG